MLVVSVLVLLFSSLQVYGNVPEFLQLSPLGVENIPVCNAPETESCLRVEVNFTLLRSNPERLTFPGDKILSILGPDEVDEETSGVTYDVSHPQIS